MRTLRRLVKPAAIAVVALLVIAMVVTMITATPAAAQQPIGRYHHQGTNYTVYEQPAAQPGADRYLYFVEDPPASFFDRLQPRASGTETAAIVAVLLLALGSAMAIHRRRRLATLL